MVVTRKALLVLGLFGLTAWSEIVHWRASRALVHMPVSARFETVVVLGCWNRRGNRANALNRWRMRAALRSIDHTLPKLGPGLLWRTSGASSVSEAALLARYAVSERGFTGTVRLDERSRSTWENVRNVIPLIEDTDQIKIVSNPLHAQKARLYLCHQRPDLVKRVVRAADYRLGGRGRSSPCSRYTAFGPWPAPGATWLAEQLRESLTLLTREGRRPRASTSAYAAMSAVGSSLYQVGLVIK